MKALRCPKGHGSMKLKKTRKAMTFRGVDVAFEADAYVCPQCGLEAGTVQSAGAIQRAIADAYRKKMDLLTGEEIKELRKARRLTQQDLADLMNLGIASIKRWETGLIQSKSMDQALRMQLQSLACVDEYTGNREFSIPRVKLVIRTIEKNLGKRILKKTDKMLFAAKYLWYADMLAFKFLGRSMTGSTYAALPYGPQLNNYTDLIDEIKRAEESEAEPLSKDELRIIDSIVKKFPRERMVFNAAHREKVWKQKATGALIAYSDAFELTKVI
jgi:putative zinc finger/helix-turn-helix YgiT family protein